MPKRSETERRGRSFALYRAQRDFDECETQVAGFVGGRGTGKSEVSAFTTMRRAKSGRLYGIVAPTYPILKLTIWRTFLRMGYEMGNIVAVNKADHNVTILTTDGGTAEVAFRSGDDPDRLRGPNMSGAVLEEASLMSEEVWEIMIACLREGGELGWMRLAFTPKGKSHWTYSLFYDADDGGHVLRPNRALVRARSDDNPFLPEGYAENLRDNYTTALASQEVDGEFVDVEGLLFKRTWFTDCDPSEVPPRAKRVRYWDKAGTEGAGDWTAGVLVAYADNKFYVEDVVRGQWSPGDRNKRMREVAAADHKRYRGAVNIWVEQEPGSGGKESAILSILNLAGYIVQTETAAGQQHRIVDHLRVPGTGKIVRAQPLASQAEHGNVVMVRGAWNRAWLDEMCAFPEAKHDDQVDATAGAFNKLALRQPATKDTPHGVKVTPTNPRSVQLDRRGGRRLFG